MLYAIHDFDKKIGGAKEVTYNQAKELNKQGYGIFFTPNTFNGQRKAENLKEVKFFIADIDDGTKEEQMDRIKSLVLKPSIIVETNKGYHCYWRIKDFNPNREHSQILSNYKEVELGLVKKLKADPHATDVSRLLRYPNFYHMKNPEKPFLVREVERNSCAYTEEQMLFAYRLPKPKFKSLNYKGKNEDMLNPDMWNKIFGYDKIMAEGRNNFFTRVVFWLRDSGFDGTTIRQQIYNMNSKLSDQLPQWEVETILRSKGI